mgnify:CR=1 FL=1
MNSKRPVVYRLPLQDWQALQATVKNMDTRMTRLEARTKLTLTIQAAILSVVLATAQVGSSSIVTILVNLIQRLYG